MINKSFVLLNVKKNILKKNSNKNKISYKSKEIENEKEKDSEIDDYEPMNDY